MAKTIFTAEQYTDKVSVFFKSYLGIITVMSMIFLTKYVDNLYISFPMSMIVLFGSIFLKIYYLDPKMLIINKQGIRCPLRWNLKWTTIKDLDFDKHKRALTITTTDDKIQSFNKIKECDIECFQNAIETKIRMKLL